MIITNNYICKNGVAGLEEISSWREALYIRDVEKIYISNNTLSDNACNLSSTIGIESAFNENYIYTEIWNNIICYNTIYTELAQIHLLGTGAGQVVIANIGFNNFYNVPVNKYFKETGGAYVVTSPENSDINNPFFEPGELNYKLRPISNAIDIGVNPNSSIYPEAANGKIPSRDFDANQRPFDAVGGPDPDRDYDQGADEYINL